MKQPMKKELNKIDEQITKKLMKKIRNDFVSVVYKCVNFLYLIVI